MSDTIGNMFQVTTFGESHGKCIGAVIEGCPAGLEISAEEIQVQLDRRRPGQSGITTARREADKVEIVCGIEGGRTVGAPIVLSIANEDIRPSDYAETVEIPRPSHADYTYRMKYGHTSRSGGGRASARETAARVAAGAVAEKLLAVRSGVEIVAWVRSVGTIEAGAIDEGLVSRRDVDATAVRCPDRDAAAEMEKAIRAAADAGDSLGGIVSCVCRNVPAGWGEPVFGKLNAVLGMAMLTIPAAKGFETGSGFAGTRMKGSEHNDMFVMKQGRLGTVTNRSGGIQGGISNGEPVVFRVGFKPVASIRQPQDTVDYSGRAVTLELKKGRHDPCVLPRAVPVVEAMAAMVLADMALMAGVRL